MKRKEFIKYLENHSCGFVREGKKHTVYVNKKSGKCSTVPRHTEINDFLIQKICRDLEVERP